MQWIEIEINGRRERVPVARAGGRLWYHWRGQTHVVEVTRGRTRPGAARVNLDPGVLRAPMPGKITKVEARVGDPVAKGRVLVIMEAMKMEYTLSSDIDGHVGQVKVEAGASVAQGDVLATVIRS